MSWTGLPCDATTDWQSLSFREQFCKAIRERDWAINGTWASHTMPSAGDDCQKALDAYLGPASIQNWITGNADLFCPTGSHVGDTTKPAYTYQTLWAAAGVDASGWTRKYPREIASPYAGGSSGQRARCKAGGTAEYYEHNGTSWQVAADQTSPPDTVETYGVAQPGDYLGPWLFNEVYDCLQLMTCLSLSCSIVASGQYKQETVWDEASFAAAKTAIESQWSTSAAPSSSAANPTSWNMAQCYSGGTKYMIRAQRQTASFQISPRSIADTGRLDCDVTFYIIGESYNGTFSNMGDSIADGTAVVAETLTAEDGGQTTITSSEWNAVNANVIPNSPYAAEPGSGETTDIGYKAKEIFAVMDFGITGGFEYV